MDEERKRAFEELKNASPLEATKYLQELEMYDRKSSQEIIDEVYKEFASGENMESEILTPVFTSILDGFMEGTSVGRNLRKQGLTASRVVEECKTFQYDEPNSITDIDGYTEYKNARENDAVNSNMTQEYNSENRSKLYEDKAAMEKYKEERVMGEKSLVDEYTGKRNLYLKQKNPNEHYNDPTHRQQAQPDHIVPLKQVHEEFKKNYALDDSDIKRIANIDDNLAVTSAKINQEKLEKSNKEYIEWKKQKGEPLDAQTEANMLRMQKEAEAAIKKKANQTIAYNIIGKVDKKSIDAKYNKKIESKIKAYENKHGEKPSQEKIESIKKQVEKEKTAEIQEYAVRQKEKSKEIAKNSVSDAANQAKDYAIGNVILYIVKPLYYEISDIFKNGMKEGVNASSVSEAFKIRFGRVKNHVITHAKEFIGDSVKEFIKGFISSLIEGIVNLFVGIFKQILKVIKEGIKIFVQSAKVLFGKDSKEMTAAQKGDAIIKIIGGSIIGIAGIAIEALLNKIGIMEPWSVILSTMLSGIASALFMYLLDKIDLFSVKAEKRRDRILEIFNERIKDIEEATSNMNTEVIEVLRQQRISFEGIRNKISAAINSDDIDSMNSGLYAMAEFMGVQLEYANTAEFCDYMDNGLPEYL